MEQIMYFDKETTLELTQSLIVNSYHGPKRYISANYQDLKESGIEEYYARKKALYSEMSPEEKLRYDWTVRIAKFNRRRRQLAQYYGWKFPFDTVGRKDIETIIDDLSSLILQGSSVSPVTCDQYEKALQYITDNRLSYKYTDGLEKAVQDSAAPDISPRKLASLKRFEDYVINSSITDLVARDIMQWIIPSERDKNYSLSNLWKAFIYIRLSVPLTVVRDLPSDINIQGLYGGVDIYNMQVPSKQEPMEYVDLYEFLWEEKHPGGELPPPDHELFKGEFDMFEQFYVRPTGMITLWTRQVYHLWSFSLKERLKMYHGAFKDVFRLKRLKKYNPAETLKQFTKLRKKIMRQFR